MATGLARCGGGGGGGGGAADAALALALLVLGAAVSALALGGHAPLLARLGPAWLAGPALGAAGLLLAARAALRLRRRALLRALLRRRAALREMAAAHAEQALADRQVVRTASTVTLPPSYEALVVVGSSMSAPSETVDPEVPPPTYEEAMFLIGDEKSHTITHIKCVNECGSKDVDSTSYLCQSHESIDNS